MFTTDRVFSTKSPKTSGVSWYFQAREGDFGPYDSKDEAKTMLTEYIEECLMSGNDGGRTQKGKADNQPRTITKYLGKRIWY